MTNPKHVKDLQFISAREARRIADRVVFGELVGLALHAAWRLRGRVDEPEYALLERVGFGGVAAAQIAIALTYWWGASA